MKRLLFAFSLCLTLLASTTVRAETLLKSGTLAPEGSPWLNKWYDFTKDFQANSPTPIKIVTYPGGVMGDEADMVRKLKFGQLQMLGVTVAGIAALMPEILVLNLPFLFNNYAEVDHVVKEITPDFQKLAAERGIHLVGLLDQGMIEAYSKTELKSPEEFIKQRVWIWNADPIAVKLTEALGINAVMLPVPEVLTSLQTGLVDSMFSSSTALVALQWHTQMNYYYPFRLRYDPAVFFITDKALNKIPADKREVFKTEISETFAKHFGPFAAELRQTEANLAKEVVEGGVKKIVWDEKAAEPIVAKSKATWDELAGELYPPELLAKVKAALADYRAAQ